MMPPGPDRSCPRHPVPSGTDALSLRSPQCPLLSSNSSSDGLLQAGWGTLAIYLLVVTQLTIFSVTLYLHRSQAHRGVDFHPLVAHVLPLLDLADDRRWSPRNGSRSIASTTPSARPRKIRTARCRRASSTVFWRGVELYREARGQREDIEKYGKGCPDDWIERHLYTPHATMGPTLLLFISFALFGFVGVAVWAIQMLWIPFWAAGVVNGLGHWWGYRNFETDDTATNLTPWGVLDRRRRAAQQPPRVPELGEVRAAQVRVRHRLGGDQRAARSVGLAKVLRVAPSLDVRPNISCPTAKRSRRCSRSASRR